MWMPLPPRPVICLDPGHPSEVGVGTRGKRLTELGVDWMIAVQVRDRLLLDGYTVVMTKQTEPEKVTNKRRAEIANQSRAALFLRLHCDAASNRGSTTYYPTQPGRAQGVTGPAPEVLALTAPVAASFHRAFAASLKGKHPDLGLKPDLATHIGGQQGALTGSIFARVPTVLVEMVVLTNAADEAWIASAAGQRAMVDGLVAGVEAAVPRSRSK